MQTVDIVNNLPKLDFGSNVHGESKVVKMYPENEDFSIAADTGGEDD